MGLEIAITNIPHINCPLLVIYPFIRQNQKKVFGLTNEVPDVFEEGYQDQSACLEGVVLALCTLH
jgi:hypothetical protein